MKLIIAGTRSLYVSTKFIFEVLEQKGINGAFSQIVSGGANGIDYCGEEYANWAGISLKRFIADWKKYGNAAGPKRNEQMAKYGDALLLIWDGKSKGSKNMKENMLKLNKPIYEVILK